MTGAQVGTLVTPLLLIRADNPTGLSPVDEGLDIRSPPYRKEGVGKGAKQSAG